MLDEVPRKLTRIGSNWTAALWTLSLSLRGHCVEFHGLGPPVAGSISHGPPSVPKWQSVVPNRSSNRRPDMFQTELFQKGIHMSLQNNNREDPPNLQIRPWSPLAVQALFDAPRILVRPGRASTTTTRRRRRRSWLDWQVGPTSSVVLDTTFVNSQVRIGMGGTSGTRFVFGRLTEDQGAIGQPLHVWKEATEFQTILSSSQGPWSHRQALGG